MQRRSLPGWDRQTTPAEGKPYLWLQWKGTRACADFHCACGAWGHFDRDFLYYVRCPMCGAAYMVNGYVELVPLTEEERAEADLNLKEPYDVEQYPKPEERGCET